MEPNRGISGWTLGILFALWYNLYAQAWTRYTHEHSLISDDDSLWCCDWTGLLAIARVNQIFICK